MANFVSEVGPLFGPNFVIVTVNDETGREFERQIYPLDVEVSGPNFTDEPVFYSTGQPVRIRVPKGRIKWIR
ncbi:hypothetical protein OG342_00285 [Streptomyces bobili]|uniref:hypothetical protein n=1 Tax=Streptomyces TaxID=1883 RepID=UPI00225B8035|nr:MULTISPECIES: hypothetical protein [Streptomyces]MCX5521338.1 hypothetical protein [Streptomyces bobili]MDX3570968.1 hypothetical protein [Streptomyces sp. ID05-47C]